MYLSNNEDIIFQSEKNTYANHYIFSVKSLC